MFIEEEIKKAQALSSKLALNPEAADAARETMRLLLDARGIISLDGIKEEASNIFITNLLTGKNREPAEHDNDHLSPEVVSTWADEYLRILTDYYFSNTFSTGLADLIIDNSKKHNFQIGRIIEEVYLKLKEQMNVNDLYYFSEELMDNASHFVTDIKVHLIREYFSDHLNFIGIAKRYFQLADLIEMKRKIYGKGKIGGKAAGILLAEKILSLNENGQDNELAAIVSVPEFFLLGSDLCYEFLIYNGLLRYKSYRYKEQSEMESQYAQLQQDFRKGNFHPRTRAYFSEILERLDGAPFVARSSSRLEDAIGFSFAGKYKSIFCPNRGSREEQIDMLEEAVKEIYISMYAPSVIAYMKHNQLLDFEERIAVLIQKVRGRTMENGYYFPTMAGVAFSLNPYCWNQRIRKEDGIVRLVMGFGTRAVDRTGNDYARLVPLSAPTLRPEVHARDIVKYSQRYVDVINLETDSFETVDFSTVARDFNDPVLNLMISLDKGEHLSEPIGLMYDTDEAVLTFSRLLSATSFPALMKKILKKLERHIGGPVDIEFSLEPYMEKGEVLFHLSLLQCRRFNWRDDLKPAVIPVDIPSSKRLFYSKYDISNGEILNIEYIVFVDPLVYDSLKKPDEKTTAARIISRLNRTLSDKTFILMGPGRWGSNDANLGVKITYGDIHHTRMLVEVAYEKGGYTPEVSYGTHFYLDLIEGRISVLPLYPDRELSSLDREFLLKNNNRLPELLPEYAEYSDLIRVINVPECTEGDYLQVRMNSGASTAIGYFSKAEAAEKPRDEMVLLPI
ncbi:MAG: PEP/pyruvate-binding domain-containing protein [Candidatus Xenobiia bacterium LiM19]